MNGRRGMRSVNWRSLAAALSLVTVAIPAAASGAAHAQAVRAPSALIHQAQRAPNRLLPVIVEKHGTTTVPEQLIRRAGGKVTRSLSIINAVAARVPGWAARELAANSSVNWLAPDAVVYRQSKGGDHGGGDHGNGGHHKQSPSSNVVSYFDQAVGADTTWSNGYLGSGINVAVVDSGVTPDADLNASRIVAATSVIPTDPSTIDQYGHGTHVAGIIAGDGTQSNGQYVGIAPKAGIVSVKVFDAQGNSKVSTVIAGLQWIYDHRTTYNIKVVNLSLSTNLNESYNIDPLDAACEILWFNKVTVVVAAGNNGSSAPGVVNVPANDPFVITVGAVDDKGTTTPSDDTVASFSAYGTTVDGFSKPDVVAPGTDIISSLASSSDTLALAYPSHVVNSSSGEFFDMSGTSMAAPMVSGAAALMLQAHPTLNPDQIKHLLEATASPIASMTGAGAGEFNAQAAIQSPDTATANTGIAPSAGLKALNPAIGATWDSASWGSASWGSASWGSASWGSASWGSASWGSASWGSASWGSDYWGSTRRHPHGGDTTEDHG